MIKKTIVLFSCWVSLPLLAQGSTMTIDHGEFKLLYDCENRTALRFEYTAKPDVGNLKRRARFTRDPSIPETCQQQFSQDSYAKTKPGWDRGHLVPANHMDHQKEYLRSANYMTNIVPQQSKLNGGIWAETELLVECYRDQAPVRVYGGVVYSDPNNDYFVTSHGIKTPDYFWKTLITRDPSTKETKTISWYIPHIDRPGPLDRYIVSISELEQKIGAEQVAIQEDPAIKQHKPAKSWARPKDCQPG